MASNVAHKAGKCSSRSVLKPTQRDIKNTAKTIYEKVSPVFEKKYNVSLAEALSKVSSLKMQQTRSQLAKGSRVPVKVTQGGRQKTIKAWAIKTIKKNCRQILERHWQLCWAKMKRLKGLTSDILSSKHKNTHLESNYKDALAHLQTQVLAENGRCKRELLDWEEN